MSILVADRIKDLAVELTKVRSIVGTSGEVEVSEKIHKHLKQLDYFQQHPQYLFYHETGDSLGRKSVIAVVKGQKGSSRDTVVLISHMDTVGIEDYGDLKEFAVDPDKLTQEIKNKKLDEEVIQDLESGEWLFGRGIFDMKTGVAAQMVLLEEMSKKVHQWEGNIVFVAVPDEEGNSAGMLTAVDALKELKRKEGFSYIAAIDTDYMAPRYPGDENRYIYIGTVGKLLPCFFVVGKETHVGEAFGGLDPNLLSSELMNQIDLSDKLCDVVEGESTLPPISLRQQDLKTEYSAQTAHTANVYFNYATHSQTPDAVVEKLKEKATIAFENVIERLNKRYKEFCEKSNMPYKKLPWKSRVMTFEELYTEVKNEMGDEIDEKIRRAAEEINPDVDDRDYSLRIVKEVHKHYSDRSPVIILYFAPPYYPHIYVKGENQKEKRLLEAVERAVHDVKSKCEHSIVIRKFYPYISDLSFCAVTADENQLKTLINNMPAWPEKYSLPVESIKALSMPVVNIGPFGKDAHKLTERVHIPYSFNIMPEILFKTVEQLLEK